jgi:hypothetical protein
MRCTSPSPMLPESVKPRTRKAVMTNSTQPGIVVSTAITAGPGSGAGGVWMNHADGIVVSTAITAGPGSGAGGVWMNHGEAIVGR